MATEQRSSAGPSAVPPVRGTDSPLSTVSHLGGVDGAAGTAPAAVAVLCRPLNTADKDQVLDALRSVVELQQACADSDKLHATTGAASAGVASVAAQLVLSSASWRETFERLFEVLSQRLNGAHAVDRDRGGDGASPDDTPKAESVSHPLTHVSDASIVEWAVAGARLVRRLCREGTETQLAFASVRLLASFKGILSSSYLSGEGGEAWESSVRRLCLVIVQTLVNIAADNDDNKERLWAQFVPAPTADLYVRYRNDDKVTAAVTALLNCCISTSAQSFAKAADDRASELSLSGILSCMLAACVSTSTTAKERTLSWSRLVIARVLEVSVSLAGVLDSISASDGGHAVPTQEQLIFFSIVEQCIDCRACTLRVTQLADIVGVVHRIADEATAIPSGVVRQLLLQTCLQAMNCCASAWARDEASLQFASLVPAATDAIVAVLRISPVAMGAAVTTTDKTLPTGFATAACHWLSNVVHEHPEAQEEAFRKGLVAPVLNMCKVDDRNPLSREWALVCVRNMCAGSENVRKQISALKAKSVVETPELAKLNIKADVTDAGEVRVTQREPAADHFAAEAAHGRPKPAASAADGSV